MTESLLERDLTAAQRRLLEKVRREGTVKDGGRIIKIAKVLERLGLVYYTATPIVRNYRNEFICEVTAADPLDVEILEKRAREDPKFYRPGAPTRTPRPENCKRCKRPLYSNHLTYEQAPPGTYRHTGRGYCATCYGAEARAGSFL